jgi:hypothetical protein
MIATATSGPLLIGEVNGSMRRAAASGLQCVRIGGISNRRKMQLVRKDCSSQRGLQSYQIVQVERGSAQV